MSRVAFQYVDLCRSAGACENCAPLLREGLICPCQGFGCDCGPESDVRWARPSEQLSLFQADRAGSDGH